MNISIIIPTYNAEPYLAPLLESLQKQTLAYELIIIDSSSSDNTVKIARTYTDNVIVIPQDTFDHGGTRTKAAQIATGEFLVFLTQDALPFEENSIEKLIKVFENIKIGAAFGRQIPYPQTSLFGTHLRAFNYPETSYVRTLKDKEKYGIKTAFLSDSFAVYRRSALEEIGWFKDGLILGEDNYAGAKLLLADYALAYCAQAKVYHSHSYSITQEFKRYFDIGVFHKQESWLLDTFGKAEGEGGKYVKSEFNYLLKQHAYHLIPTFFIRNALKYAGYKLGQQYQILPKELTKKLSMHTLWWEK